MVEFIVHYGACNEGWNESFQSIDEAIAFAREVAPESTWCWVELQGGFEGLPRLPKYVLCEASKTGGKWYIGKTSVSEADAKKFLEKYVSVGQSREKRILDAIEKAEKDFPKTGEFLYDALLLHLPEIDVPLTEEETKMQEKILALCKEMEEE